MNLKNFLILIVMIFPVSVFGKEDCSDQALEIDSSTHIIDSIFYRGTCHYRNEEYDISAKYWGEISEMKEVDSEYEDLQISSLNNLGYLFFYGYGIKKDQVKAIEYWTKAVSLGHMESKFHLCHAYADKDDGAYNHRLAKEYCDKAEAAYKAIEGKDDRDKETLKQIQAYKKSIGS